MSASIAHDGFQGTGTAVTSSTLAVTGTAGNAMILCMSFSTKTRTLSSVTDSASNVGWTALVQNSSSTAGSAVIAWIPNMAAGITTVTLNFSGTTRVSMGWMDVAGLTGAVDGTPTGANNTVTQASPAVSTTTTNADDFIVACLGIAPTTLNSINSPFTQDVNGTGSGGSNLIVPATTEQLTTGTYTCTWNLAAAVVNSTAIAAFKVTGGGGGGATLRELMMLGVGV